MNIAIMYEGRTMKYNKTPSAQTSTGPPTYESSLNTVDVMKGKREEKLW